MFSRIREEKINPSSRCCSLNNACNSFQESYIKKSWENVDHDG